MNRRLWLYLAVGLLLPLTGWAADTMRFWNLTNAAITSLTLAPTGTTQFGPNQCENDSDKEVDADERLTLKGIAPGHYDVKLTDKNGRKCLVRDVEVKAGGPYAFSIDEDALKGCKAH